MNRYRILALLGVLSALLFAWLYFSQERPDDSEAVEPEGMVKEDRSTSPDPSAGEESEAEIARVNQLLALDERDSLHPVERAVARGQILDSRLSNQNGGDQWIRTRLVRSDIQPNLLRVVEEWRIDPVTDTATAKRRDLYLADQVIVKMKSGVTEELLGNSLSVLGMRLGKSLGSDLYTVRLPEATLEAVPTALITLGKLTEGMSQRSLKQGSGRH